MCGSLDSVSETVQRDFNVFTPPWERKLTHFCWLYLAPPADTEVLASYQRNLTPFLISIVHSSVRKEEDSAGKFLEVERTKNGSVHLLASSWKSTTK